LPTLSSPKIHFQNVWKKYSRREIFHRSIREDALQLFAPSKSHVGELQESEFWVLKNLDFCLSSGDCVRLAGPNGSGKTTILKLISRVTLPTRGCVSVQGRVAPLLEVGPGFHPDLTGRENIYMNGTILGMSISEIRVREQEIVHYAEIAEFINTPVKKYSSGMLMRLGFAIAIHSGADIYLFDEIFSVADQEFRERCYDSIKEMVNSGKIVLLVNHDKNNYGINPNKNFLMSGGNVSPFSN